VGKNYTATYLARNLRELSTKREGMREDLPVAGVGSTSSHLGFDSFKVLLAVSLS